MGIPMKLRIVLATSAALALAACGKSPTTTESPGNASAAATTAATAEASPATTAPAADGTLSEAYLIGKWADVVDGNCKLAQEFKPGGKVDGLFDSWKLAGNVLTVGMMGETQNLTVKVIDQKTMETQIAGAKPHRLRRC
jgi:hypothetical protein